MAEQTKKETTSADLIGAIQGADIYRKTFWDWNDWYPLQDEVLAELREEWYMRRIIPRPQRVERINLDNPFPPQGDIIVFILNGHPRWNNLAKEITLQIEEYARVHSSDYGMEEYSRADSGDYSKTGLRIRCVIVQTAQAYIAELEKTINGYPDYFDKEEDEAECMKILEVMQEKQRELIRVKTTVAKTRKRIDIDNELKEKQTIRGLWDNLFDSVLFYEEKLNDKVESFSKENESTLNMSKVGRL